MTDTENNSPSVPLHKKRWFRVTFFSAVIIIFTLSVVPLIINEALKSWLINNGADYVSIEDIDFNPFNGTAAIRNLDVRIDDKPVLSNSLLLLDINILALFTKGIAVDAATLKKFELNIEKTSDGKLRIGSYVVDPSKESDDEIIKGIEKDLAWWLQLSNIKLENSIINYHSPEFSARFMINTLALNDLNTKDRDLSATLVLDGKFNQSKINADVKIEQISPNIKARGSISIEHVMLNAFSGLTKNTLNDLKGIASTSGKFSFNFFETSKLQFDYTGKSSLTGTNISNNDFDIKTTSLQYDGGISLNQAGSNDGFTLKASGEIVGTGLSAKLPDSISLQAAASWKGDLSYTASANDSASKIMLGGEFGVNNYEVLLPELAIRGKNTSWAGKLDYEDITNTLTQDIQLNGQLNSSELHIALEADKLSISQKSLSLKSNISLKINKDQTDISGTVNIVANGSEIQDDKNKQRLLVVSSLEIPTLVIESIENMTIPEARIKGAGLLQAADSTTPAFAIANSEITALNYQADKLSIQKISIDKLTGDIVREKDGSINLGRQLTASNSANAPEDNEPFSDQQTGNAEKGWEIFVSELIIKDHSVINYSDLSLSPPFKSSLDIDSLKINNIDSSKPEQPVDIKLDAKLNNYAKLIVSGTVKPFLDTPAVDLKAKLINQNMVTLSPFVISSTGYLVRSGQMNIDSSIVIKEGVIDAKNALFMKKLRLDEANESDINKHAGSIGMPLDKALGMLRDKNDNIKLEIPIHGKLDEIDIGTGQILNTVLKKATTAGMKTYLLYAFQPYGALIIVGQTIGKQIGKIRLEPVYYESGKSELTSQQKDYLKKLGKVLQDRPKLDVQICSFTIHSDLSPEKKNEKNKDISKITKDQLEASNKLGLKRQKYIKDYLISSFGIKDGRLILCSPEHDDKEDAKARVELLI